MAISSMMEAESLVRGAGDPHAQPGDVVRLVGGERQAQRRRVDEDEAVPAIGGVDRQRAEAFHLQRNAEPRGEARQVLHEDPLGLSLPALGAHSHEATRRLEDQLRHRFLHGDEAAVGPASSGEAVPLERLDEIAQDMLTDVLELMGIEGEVSVRSVDVESDSPTVVLDVEGDDLGVLIGRRGDTLAALQYLLTLMVQRRLRRWTRCLFGHRPGETWFRVTKGKRPERMDVCTRCGVRVAKGRLTW